MDGEANDFELRRVLDEARSNPELRGYWHRQHLLGSVIRGEDISAQDSLRERLLAEMEELSDETHAEGEELHEVQDPEPTPNPWFGRLAGTAVAAAVAVLVVVNADLLTGGPEQPGFEITQTNPIQPIQTAPVMYDVAKPADINRTDALIVHHIQQNALNNPGASSLIRFIAFDRKEPQPLVIEESTSIIDTNNPSAEEGALIEEAARIFYCSCRARVLSRATGFSRGV